MTQGKARLFAQAVRPQMTVLPWLLYSAVLVGYEVTNVFAYVLGFFFLVIAYGIVTLLNDLADYEIDMENGRTMPLARGLLSQEEIGKCIGSLSIAGVVVGWLLAPPALLWLSIYVFMGWLYSGAPNFKGRGLIAEVILGICYGVMPFVLGLMVAGAPSVGVEEVCIMIASFSFSGGVSLLKDFKDVRGDRLHGKLTPLVRYGPRTVHRLVVGLTSCGYVLLLVENIGGRREEWQLLMAATLLLAGANFLLLRPRRLLTDPAARKRRGTASRSLFFIWAAGLSCLAFLGR